MNELEQKPPHRAPPTWWELSKSTQMSERIEESITEMFTEQPLDEDQTNRLLQARSTLIRAALVIEAALPAGTDRDAALRKIREAYSDCRNAVTFRGRY